MDDVEIRRAREDDLPALRWLYREFHMFHVDGVPQYLRAPERDVEAEANAAILALITADDALLLVALVDGEVVGLAEVYRRRTDKSEYVNERRYALLQSLAVREDKRRHGLGQRLLAAVYEWARHEDLTEVEVEAWEFAGDPVPFYLRNGFHPIKRKLVFPLPDTPRLDSE